MATSHHMLFFLFVFPCPTNSGNRLVALDHLVSSVGFNKHDLDWNKYIYPFELELLAKCTLGNQITPEG